MGFRSRREAARRGDETRPFHAAPGSLRIRRSRASVLAAGLAMGAVVAGLAASPASAILYRIKPGHWVSYESRLGKPTPHTSPKSMRLSSGSNYEIFNGSDGYLNYSGGPIMPSSKAYVFVWKGPITRGATSGAA
jgi:hypothetical protein